MKPFNTDMSLALVTAAGFVSGAFWVVARHDYLITTMSRARLSILDRADTARVVGRQLQCLQLKPSDLKEAQEVYHAVIRHQHTLAVSVPPALRDYEVLKKSYEEWTQDWVQRGLRSLYVGTRYFFEDFMEAGAGEISDAELSIRTLQRVEQEVLQIKECLKSTYPAVSGPVDRSQATSLEIRRALAPSSPR
jgi:hypothetical protein